MATKKKNTKVKKYRVQQVKDCSGYKISKYDMEHYNSGNIFASNDLNEVYQKLALIEDRIATRGSHTAGKCRYWGEYKCKGKFEIREMH